MNWYLKAISQYADFRGRARRKEFWMFTLLNIIIAYSLQFLANAAEAPALLFATAMYMFVVLIPSLAVGVRRMHDVGKSGWYLLIPIYSLILALTHSEIKNNPFGQNPKATPDAVLQKV